MRSIFEIREQHSRMYKWSALVTSQLLVEVPWNIFGSSLFFVCWYWTAGFPTDRAAYTYLLFGVIYPLYYTSFGQVCDFILDAIWDLTTILHRLQQLWLRTLRSQR